MIKLSALFDIKYGNGLELNRLDVVEEHNDNTVNFISRASKNNGVTAKVKAIDGLKPFKEGLITVSVSANPTTSFIQPKKFYTAYHIMILKPKNKMQEIEKLFYCHCLEKNRYRYNYGRQANRTLKDIKLPKIIPDWVYEVDVPDYINISKPFNSQNILLNTNIENWSLFKFNDVFEIEKGHYNNRPRNIGKYPFVSATRNNNGVSSYIDEKIVEKKYGGNCLTVVNNGNSMGETFYQENEFTCSHDVNILRLKNYKMNIFSAMFLIPIIKKEKIRFCYGRKWRLERMRKTPIRLPINSKKEPDWKFMEQYIKNLRYSKYISS